MEQSWREPPLDSGAHFRSSVCGERELFEPNRLWLLRGLCGQVHDGVSPRLFRTVLCGADDSLRPLTNLVNHAVGSEAGPAKANWKARRDNRQAEVFPEPAVSYALIDRPGHADLPVCAGLWPSPAGGNQQRRTSAAERPPAMRQNPEIQPSAALELHKRRMWEREEKQREEWL